MKNLMNQKSGLSHGPAAVGECEKKSPLYLCFYMKTINSKVFQNIFHPKILKKNLQIVLKVSIFITHTVYLTHDNYEN